MHYGEASRLSSGSNTPHRQSSIRAERARWESQLTEYERTVAVLRQRVAQLQRELDETYASKSWRITAPLRAARKHPPVWIGQFWPRVRKRLSTHIPPRATAIARQILRRPRAVPALRLTPAMDVLTEDLPAEQEAWPTSRPLISVIVPCFNYGAYVEEAVNSVLGQTLRDVEIIVVNDGSTDPNTIASLEALLKPRTRVVHQGNSGLPMARNRGIAEARGKYICCLDADDTLEPTYLEKAVSLLESNPGVGFVYPWVRLFGDQEDVWRTEAFDLRDLLGRNYISVAGVFRREDWEKVGGYTQALSHGYEDWEFWLKLAERGLRGRLIPECLFNHRLHGRTMVYQALDRHTSLVADIVRRHRALHTDPGIISQIERGYRDRRVKVPFLNLSRPSQWSRVAPSGMLLVMLPWTVAGGAEAVELEILSGLRVRFQEAISIVTTVQSENEWHWRFRRVTHEIYHLPNFLDSYCWGDFLENLIQTRGVDRVLLSGSEFGYRHLPVLKQRFPQLTVLNLLHNDSPQGHLGRSIEYDPYITTHVAVSQRIAVSLREFGNVPAKKTQVIYNGIDVEEKFNPSRSGETKARVSLGLPKRVPVVTYIGRLSPEKQPEDFLRLAADLKETHARFLLVGDGPLRDVIASQIRQLSLSRRLVWHRGVTPDLVPSVLAASDILAITSAVEGFPLVMLEALAMGVPVITYDVGEVRAAVVSGHNGWVIPRGDRNEFRRRTAALLSDERLLGELKSNARSSICQSSFTTASMVNAYAELLGITSTKQ